MGLRASAVVTRVDGRTVEFRVEAFDDKERVGDGTHTRVVVNVERFDQRVQRKLSTMSSNKPRLCFIGFGEAGQAIASGLREAGVEQHRRVGHPVSAGRGARRSSRPARAIGARLASSGGRCGRQLRHHRVGGDGGFEPRCRAIGRAASLRQSLLSRRQFGLARPQEGSRASCSDGAARYVDVAILAPIHPKRHQTPLLLAGPHAQP